MMDSQDKALVEGTQEENKQNVTPTPAEVENQHVEPTAPTEPAEAPKAEAEPVAAEAVEAPAEAAEAPKEADAEPAPAEDAPAAEAETAKAEEPEQAPEAAAPAEPEAAPAEPQAATEKVAAEEKPAAPAPEKKLYASKEEVLARVKEIAESPEDPDKEEVEHLKATFYRFSHAEQEQRQKEYLEAGGDPEKFPFVPNDAEETFKAELQLIKEKRQKMLERQQQEREANLKHREEIIEKIKNMATSPDEANRSFNDFKALQQEWKEIGPVPPEKSNETWNSYKFYEQQFYDLLNLHREAREIDFKKNLEAKEKLCEEAEKLAEEPDIVAASRRLQELHVLFREIGPVARDLREQVWARFKAASTVINKKHQQHFEELRAREEDNLKRKTELCERVEAIAKEENKGTGDWDRHAKEIIAVQQEWKKIGFAPQKMNEKIFQRFRAACDDFFGRKAEYFKAQKERYAANVEKKRALVEQAQALQDSTDWKETADKLIELQKEWKTVGPVPHRLSDKLWNEFLSACNHFFEARKAAGADSRNEERTNLEKKRSIIAQLKDVLAEAADDAQEKVQHLIEEYNQVGHVPFRDKEKVYKEFRDVLDKLNEQLHVSVGRSRFDGARQGMRRVASRFEDAAEGERGQLMRRYEQLKQQITTFENNLGFLNISSKQGNSLVDQMKKRVENLKKDAQDVYDRIKAIDKKNAEEAQDDAKEQ